MEKSSPVVAQLLDFRAQIPSEILSKYEQQRPWIALRYRLFNLSIHSLTHSFQQQNFYRLDYRGNCLANLRLCSFCPQLCRRCLVRRLCPAGHVQPLARLRSLQFVCHYRSFLFVALSSSLIIFFFSQTNNYIVGDLFLSHALMTSVKGYRASHNDHHRHLGKKDDPDHGEGNATSMRHYRVCSFLVTRTSLTGLSGMPLRPHLFTLPLHL